VRAERAPGVSKGSGAGGSSNAAFQEFGLDRQRNADGEPRLPQQRDAGDGSRISAAITKIDSLTQACRQVTKRPRSVGDDCSDRETHGSNMDELVAGGGMRRDLS